jgi:hypothetical protein
MSKSMVRTSHQRSAKAFCFSVQSVDDGRERRLLRDSNTRLELGQSGLAVDIA